MSTHPLDCTLPELFLSEGFPLIFQVSIHTVLRPEGQKGGREGGREEMMDSGVAIGGSEMALTVWRVGEARAVPIRAMSF